MTDLAPVHPPVPPHLLLTELNDLPADALLVEGGRASVYVAQAGQIPHLMTEIGRLREITFRAIGEGSGQPLDIDRYDADYFQVFGWDHANNRLTGAYRVGLIDQLLRERGLDGVYTATLFHYDQAFFRDGPRAMELGRSFVVADYQRKADGLPLLWKGLGRWIARNPDYRRLVGPVSMDRNYLDRSLHMIVGHLVEQHLDGQACHVGHRVPFEPSTEDDLQARITGALCDGVQQLDRLISSQEDGRGMPVLIRQYLRLGAKALEFNVDPDFSDVVDVLMLLDLDAVDWRRLVRFMGADQATEYRAALA